MAGREYSIFRHTFWTGDTGRALRAQGRDAQIIAAYLFTCKSANMIGLYYLPLPLLCHELGMTREGALKGLRRVNEVQFAAYDEASEVVFVPEMAFQQVGQELKPKDNRRSHVVKLCREMRKCKFFQAFMEKYRVPFDLPDLEQIEAPCKPLASPFEGSGPRRGKDQDQDQDLSMGEREIPSRNGKKKFTPPTLEEVHAYCTERGNGIDPQAFIDHYTAKGWLVGKTPMKDWRAAVRTWETRRREAQSASTNSGQQSRIEFDN